MKVQRECTEGKLGIFYYSFCSDIDTAPLLLRVDFAMFAPLVRSFNQDKTACNNARSWWLKTRSLRCCECIYRQIKMSEINMFANIERNRESFEREKMAENSLKSFKLAELFFSSCFVFARLFESRKWHGKWKVTKVWDAGAAVVCNDLIFSLREQKFETVTKLRLLRLTYLLMKLSNGSCENEVHVPT